MGEATKRTPAERALERAREGTRKQIAKREEMRPYIKSRAQDAARSKVGVKTRANLSGVKPTGKKVANSATFGEVHSPEVRQALEGKPTPRAKPKAGLDLGPASEEEAQKRWAAGMERAKQGVSKDRLDAHRANIDRRRTARLGMSERRAPVRGSAADRATGGPGGGGGRPPPEGPTSRFGSLTDEFKTAGRSMEKMGAGALKGAIKSKRHNLLGLATGAALGAAASTETGRRAIGAIKEKAKEGVDLLRKGMDKVGLTKPEQQEGLRMTQKTLLNPGQADYQRYKRPPKQKAQRRVTHARGR